jgi:DNA-binding MarR family transcriptional regulator
LALFLSLSRLLRAMVDDLHSGLARAGYPRLRAGHGYLFMAIAAEPKTAIALARELGISKQAIAQLLEVLLEERYVERRTNPDDRREQLIRLTAKGRAVTRKAARILDEIEQRWAMEVGGDTLARLQEAAQTIATAEPGAARPIW